MPSGPSTLSQRVGNLAAEVRCPSCSGLSVADSDASTAVAIRAEIRERAVKGQSDSQIESYLVSRYGNGILLRPSGTGLAALVWVLPLSAVAAAVAIVLIVLWRRRAGLPQEPTAEDRSLVESALDGKRIL